MLVHIPVWVFFIFAALLLLGYGQSRTRQVAPRAVAALALGMFGLSLYGVMAAFGVQVAPLLAWALGIATSAALGRELFGPHGLVRVSETRVQVPGSWLPLALMMGIFGAKFVLGFAKGVGAPIVGQPWFIVTSCALFGLLSGAFAARARVVWRFARRADGSPRGAVVGAA